MTLATKCTACHTVFRVVQDQLKVSEGWVRCGRCESVFNALENLVDLETSEPLPPVASAHLPSSAPPTSFVTTSQVLETPASLRQELESLKEEVVPVQKPLGPAAAHLSSDLDAFSGLTDLSARQRKDPLAQNFLYNQPIEEEILQDPALAPMPKLAEPEPPRERQRRQRAARERMEPEWAAKRSTSWNDPALRGILIGTVVVLALVLFMQLAHHFRNTWASRFPTLAPALHGWCQWVGCQIEPPRRLDDLSVEASALNPMPVRSDLVLDSQSNLNHVFRFSLTLHNKGTAPVSMPHIDLTLTDSSGQIVSRRMITPKELTPTRQDLQAGADVPLQALISTGQLRAVGYNVEIFYP
jgi:predicted Zn finger-like uncharacterized protein